MSTEQKQIVFKKSFKEGDPVVLLDYLEKYSGLSKSVLKKILNNGGVWVRKFSNSKLARTRRAQTELNGDSLIEFYFDPKFLALEIPQARVVYDQKEWGLWYKPAGLMSSGTEFGDHASILRQVEKAKNKAWLIHRLDREAHGLMLFAYTEKAARMFSTIFQKRQVQKFYKVEVLGDISKQFPDGADIDSMLDKREAKTSFKIIDSNINSSKLLVQIHTGRLHQIRRHFEELGYPVMGDPKYGKGNKNTEGMRLMAYQLKFLDPFTKKDIDFELKDVEF